MDAVLKWVLVAALVATALALWQRRRETRIPFLAAVARAARAVGLAPDPTHPLLLTGSVGGRGLVLRHRWANVEIATAAGPPLGFALDPVGNRNETPTGDLRFDAVVAVDTHDWLRALLVLDAPTRNEVEWAIRTGARFDGERFLLRIDETPTADPRALAAVFRRLARLHVRLLDQRTASIALRLRAERSVPVRLRIVDRLAAAGSLADPDVQRVVDGCDGPVRLHAALYQRDAERLRILLDVGGEGGRVRAAIAVASAGLADQVGTDRVRALLVGALLSSRGAEAAAALAWIGDSAALYALRAAVGQADPEHRRALHEAITTLTARLADRAGSLALATGRPGDLALAPNPDPS